MRSFIQSISRILICGWFVILRSFLIFLGLCSPFHAKGLEYIYTGATGDLCYYTPGNWQGGVRPSTGNTAKIADGTYQIAYTTQKNAEDGWFEVTDGIDLLIQNAIVNVAPSTGFTSRFYVTGDTTANINHSTLTSECEILVGSHMTTGVENPGPGTLNIYNGSTVLTKRYSLMLGWKEDSLGTIHLGKTGETAGSTLTSLSDAKIGAAGTGNVTVSGLSKLVSAQNITLGVEAKGEGRYTANDSSLTTASGAIVIGNAGRGEMTINDDATVRSFSNSTQTKRSKEYDFDTYAGISIGNLAGSNGTVTINSGLLEAASSTIEGEEETYSVLVGYRGTGTLNIHGGESHSTFQTLIGLHDTAVGTVNMTGGTLRSDSGIFFGIYGKAYGNIRGGTISPNGPLNLADSGENGYAELHLSGDAKVQNATGLNVGHQGKAIMTVRDKASVQIDGILRVGFQTGSEGELTIYGGTVTSNDHIAIGGDFPGRQNQMGKGVINMYGGQLSCSTDSCIAVGGKGTGEMNVYGGTVSSQSLSVAAREGSRGDFLLDGGNLRIDDFYIGEEGNAVATLKSGTFTTRNDNPAQLHFWTGPSATLNIISGNNGNNWTLGAIDVQAGSTPTLNFLAGYNDGDIAKVVANNANATTFHGDVKIGMEYPFGFLAKTEYTVLETPYTTFSLTGMKDESLFAISTPGDNKIVGTLQNISDGEYTIGDSLVLSMPGKSGVVRLSENRVPQHFELEMEISGLDDLDGLATWLESLMSDAEVGVRAEDTSLVLSNIDSTLVDGWLAWDFSGFGGNFSVVALESYEVPEPATWGMLLFGLIWLFKKRKLLA